MREGGVVEFRRSRWQSCPYLAGVAFCAFIAAVCLHREQNILLGSLYLAWVAVYGLAAVLSFKPYARVSQESITLKQHPLLPRRVIPWWSIRGARREAATKMRLTLLDGKRVKVHLDYVKWPQRAALEALLRERLGPLLAA